MAELKFQIEEDSNGDYTTLEAAVNANEQDLTDNGGDYILFEICGTDLAGDGWDSADTTVCTVDGYTTSAACYVKIYTTASARHDGKWGTAAKYRLATTTAPCLTVADDYVYVIGLQVALTSDPSANAIVLATSANYFYLVGNIITKTTNDYTIHAGVRGEGDNGKYHFYYNNIVTNMAYGFQDYTSFDAENYVTAYNNTLYSVTTGFKTYTAGRWLVKNNVVRACTDGYSGTFNAASDYNSSSVSEDAPQNAGGSGNDNTASPWYSGATADAAIFTSVTRDSEDLHLIGSTIFEDVGADLSATYVTPDIDFVNRTGTWDIGADED